MALNRFVLASAAALALAACSSSSSTSSSGSSSSTTTSTTSATTTTGSTTTGSTTSTSTTTTTASSSSTSGMTMGTTGSSASSSGSTGGTTGGSGSTGGSYVITIQNLAFSPANLDIPLGATVTVKNMDGFPHTVTSSADMTTYSNGAVDGVTFNVSLGGGVTRTFAVSGGRAGDVIPYFCAVHTSSMNPNHATITLH